ncbi:hypothetical protein [Streptomyces sp. NPDC088178]|uniref:hypothetical protein n=1 Tax=Streptomyces sp. NPDC088178 TaxID=3365836 RepID=UPI0038153329
MHVLAPEPVEEGSDEPAPSVVDPASPWKSDRFANRIRARHATVHAMLEAGHSRRSIGRQLRMTHRTVKSLADAARPEDLFTGQYQFNRASVLDEYKPYLDDRWNEGLHQRLEALGGDRPARLQGQRRHRQRLHQEETHVTPAGHRTTPSAPPGGQMDSQPPGNAHGDRAAPAQGRAGQLPRA